MLQAKTEPNHVKMEECKQYANQRGMQARIVS